MKFSYILLLIGAISNCVDASATEKAIASGAEKAAAASEIEDAENLRRSGGRSRYMRPRRTRGTTVVRRGYGSDIAVAGGPYDRYGRFNRYGYRSYYRPSILK